MSEKPFKFKQFTHPVGQAAQIELFVKYLPKLQLVQTLGLLESHLAQFEAFVHVTHI